MNPYGPIWALVCPCAGWPQFPCRTRAPNGLQTVLTVCFLRKFIYSGGIGGKSVTRAPSIPLVARALDGTRRASGAHRKLRHWPRVRVLAASGAVPSLQRLVWRAYLPRIRHSGTGARSLRARRFLRHRLPGCPGAWGHLPSALLYLFEFFGPSHAVRW